MGFRNRILERKGEKGNRPVETAWSGEWGKEL